MRKLQLRTSSNKLVRNTFVSLFYIVFQNFKLVYMLRGIKVNTNHMAVALHKEKWPETGNPLKQATSFHELCCLTWTSQKHWSNIFMLQLYIYIYYYYSQFCMYSYIRRHACIVSWAKKLDLPDKTFLPPFAPCDCNLICQLLIVISRNFYSFQMYHRSSCMWAGNIKGGDADADACTNSIHIYTLHLVSQ